LKLRITDVPAAEMSSVFTLGATDDAATDATATIGTALSILLESLAMTAVVVEKRKTPFRSGLKRGFKLSLNCNGCRGTAKALDAACQHERAVRRDEMECAPNAAEGALIEDNAGERDLDEPDTSSSSGDDDGGDDFEDACRVAHTSRLTRSLFACNADRFSILMTLAELTLSQNLLPLCDTVRRCAKCSGTWHGKRHGRAVVKHDTQWRDVVLHTMFGAVKGAGAGLDLSG
jgi:hypothetical protein